MSIVPLPKQPDIDDDDLAWARDLVDEGRAGLDRGEGITLAEHRARIAAKLESLRRNARTDP